MPSNVLPNPRLTLLLECCLVNMETTSYRQHNYIFIFNPQLVLESRCGLEGGECRWGREKLGEFSLKYRNGADGAAKARSTPS